MAFALAVILATTALGRGLPPVAGVGYPNVPIDRGKKLSAFFGYSYGQDSNVLYEASDFEQKDDFQEGLVGLIFVTGAPSRSLDVRYEGKFVDFVYKEVVDPVDLDTISYYQDHVVKGGLVFQTEKTSLMGRVSYEQFTRSTEIEAMGLLSRQRISGGADLGFRMGQTELVATGLVGVNTYPDDDSFDYMNQGFGGEFRLWRGETTHYLVHFDAGAVSYASDAKDDFGYRRVYLGLRSERTARSGYEIAAGVQGNDTEFDAFAPAQEEFFASVRCTWLMLNGRAALAAGYTQGGEASLLSDFKTVQRLTARISYAANTRLSLTWGLTSELASFGTFDPDVLPPPALPDDMTRLGWDVGVIFEIGSPERLHGRLFVSYGSQSRTGAYDHDGDGGAATPDIDYDYARTRWFGGLALVY